jgi:ribose 5-phosphate isomerase B
MGGRIAGAELAWDLVRTFLEAKYSQEPRHLRRLEKVASLEEWHTAPHYGNPKHDERATG